MSNTNFNKDDWKIKYYEQGELYISAGGKWIANINEENSGYMYNAHLISAAPKLYAELEESLEVFKAIYYLTKSFGAKQSIERIESVLEIARGEK